MSFYIFILFAIVVAGRVIIRSIEKQEYLFPVIFITILLAAFGAEIQWQLFSNMANGILDGFVGQHTVVWFINSVLLLLAIRIIYVLFNGSRRVWHGQPAPLKAMYWVTKKSPVVWLLATAFVIGALQDVYVHAENKAWQEAKTSFIESFRNPELARTLELPYEIEVRTSRKGQELYFIDTETGVIFNKLVTRTEGGDYDKIKVPARFQVQAWQGVKVTTLPVEYPVPVTKNLPMIAMTDGQAPDPFLIIYTN